MAQDNKNSIIGVIAIAIGILMVMGALSFLGVSFLVGPPPLFLLAASLQLLLGLTACAAGFMLMRGSVAALYILIVVVVCVFIYTVFYAVTLVTWVTRGT